MDSSYISSERRISCVKGTGVQYIPGHEETFVDYILESFLPNMGEILDLAGGGLRFAIPVALKGRRIIVVDKDEGSLNIEGIVARVLANSRIRTT